MMKIAYVNVPKDILKIKEKWFFGLTKRDTITFIMSATLGYTSYLVLKQYIGKNSIYIAGIIFISIFFLGFFEDDGVFLEDKVKNYIYFQKSKKIKVYKSENLYSKIQINSLIDEKIKNYKKLNERRLK